MIGCPTGAISRPLGTLRSRGRSGHVHRVRQLRAPLPVGQHPDGALRQPDGRRVDRAGDQVRSLHRASAKGRPASRCARTAAPGASTSRTRRRSTHCSGADRDADAALRSHMLSAWTRYSAAGRRRQPGRCSSRSAWAWPWQPGPHRRTRVRHARRGLLFVNAGLYPWRRRWRTRPLGTAQRWLQLHVYGSVLALLFVLIHVGFRWPAGMMGWLLLLLSFWATVTGLAGRVAAAHGAAR